MKKLTLIVNRKKEADDANKNASFVEKKEFILIDQSEIISSIDKVLHNINDIKMLTIFLRGSCSKIPSRLRTRKGGYTKEEALRLVDFLCDEIYTEQGNLIKALPTAKQQN